jgi:pimeloyl-ACP methyl ester carboxylesterase
LTSLSAATVDGFKLHSTSSGKGPRTIILVHGWTCDDTTWESQVPALSKDYRVLTIDLPGHGKSGSPKDGKLSMDLFARAVESVRGEAGADRVIVVGHSMGTAVIVQYARLYPQHVAAMVFVDGLVTPPNMGPADGPPPEQQISGPYGIKVREGIVRSMFSAATTPDMQKHILAMMLGAPEATAIGAMYATLDPAVWKGDVLTQPILGLYADKSALANREYMKTHFPNLQYMEIAGTGHFLMLEKPDEFNRLLLEFLSKQAF